MIKLKNGYEVKYDNDFDVFFQNLLEAIIKESRKDAIKSHPEQDQDSNFNDTFLKELMDNCILVTHQLFELRKQNEELSRFLITGFLFNSIILSMPRQLDEMTIDSDNDEDTIH